MNRSFEVAQASLTPACNSRKLNRSPFVASFALALALAITLFAAFSPAAEASPPAAFQITTITNDVVGLKSTAPTSTAYPNTFPVAAHVCNTSGTTIDGLTAELHLGTGSGTGETSITASGPITMTLRELKPGVCDDAYFAVQVARTATSFGASRHYTFEVRGSNYTQGFSTGHHEISVERLVSQNRNSTLDLTGPAGCDVAHDECEPPPTDLVVGNTYTYRLYGATPSAVQNFEASVNFPGSIFRVVRASTTTSEGTSPEAKLTPSMFVNACELDLDYLDSPYKECLGSNTTGGDYDVTYTVKVIGAGSGTLKSVIYEGSGGTWHMNSDYGNSGASAAFTARYPLNLTVEGTGNVVSSPSAINCGVLGADCQKAFTTDTNVTLTRTAAGDSEFVGWSGACTGTDEDCTVNMSEVRNVTAHFTDGSVRPLNVSVSGDGYVTSGSEGIENCGATTGDCSETWAEGTTVTLIASPSEGHSFAGWSGDGCSGMVNSCSVTMSQARNISAVFTPTIATSYGLTVIADGNGYVASDPATINCGYACTTNVDADTEVTLHAIARPGSLFMGWSRACSGTSESCTVTMDQLREVDALFVEANTLSISTTGAGSGYVDSDPEGINCGATCSHVFPASDSVTLYPHADEGSAFTGWSGADCPGFGSCTVSMEDEVNVTANFALLADLTIERTGTGQGNVESFPGGIDCGATCTASFLAGDSVMLTESETPGSQFTGWSGVGTGACDDNETCTVDLDDSRTVTANFDLLNPLQVTVEGNGEVTSSPSGMDCSDYCTANFRNSDQFELTATPAPGWYFVGWYGECDGLGTCNVSMNESRDVYASFSFDDTPPPDTRPQIYGTPLPGTTLSSSVGEWPLNTDFEFSYQWQLCEVDGEGCNDIGGATSDQYTVLDSQVGSTFRLKVRALGPDSYDETQISDYTSVVAAEAPTNGDAPTITGDAIEGQTLTAHNGSWSGTPTIEYSYQWYACQEGCIAIDGATDSTFVVPTNLNGSTIKVGVTASNAGGANQAFSDETDTVVLVSPSIEEYPAVSGNGVEGETLSTTTGYWNGNDLSYTYQWMRCVGEDECVAIEGATSTDYTIQSADIGALLTVYVTATNSGGSYSVYGQPGIFASDDDPVVTTPPSISGTPHSGQTLTLDPGQYSSASEVDYAYNWLRCDLDGDNCEVIDGETTSTYTTTDADLDHTIRGRVTAYSATGETVTDTDATGEVEIDPTLPVITGTPTQGQIFTTSNGESTVTGGELIYYYVWDRCDSDGLNCEDVASGSNTYELTAADVGHTIRSNVTTTNTEDYQTKTSRPSAIVGGIAPTNSVLPSISGSTMEGETLTADVGEWEGTPTITYAYQWYNCLGDGGSCEPVVAANDANYTVPNIPNITIAVEVTATNDAGSSSAFSYPTDGTQIHAPVSGTPPEISGDAEIGATLTTTNGEWSGSGSIYYDYQWRRCPVEGGDCDDIVGATSTSYVVTSDDEGFTLSVAVTAGNEGGENVAYGDSVGPVFDPNRPVITGTTTQGQTLTTTTGVFPTLSGELEYNYQWARCTADGSSCGELFGANSQTYVLTAADAGHRMRVGVTAFDGDYDAVQYSLQTAVIASTATPPEISGDAVSGQTLTTTNGTWATNDQFIYDYLWQRCDIDGANCADIADATDNQLVLTDDDIGYRIRVRVRADNGEDRMTQYSDATAPVTASIPMNLVRPTVTGDVFEGQTLTAHDGTWIGSPEITFTYQWYMCDVDGADCVPIDNATGATYVVPGFAYKTYMVGVTATNDGGSATDYSDVTQTSTVNAASPIFYPEISGTLAVGELLTTTDGEWSGADPITYSYQWRRCDSSGNNCQEILDATDSSYLLTEDDQGSTVTVIVTANNPGGYHGVSVDPPVGPIAAAIDPNQPVVTGSTHPGHTLSTTNGVWPNLFMPSVDFYYGWQRCDTAGDNCVGIEDADQSTLLLTTEDVGHTIRSVVTASESYGEVVEQQRSLATAVVTSVNSPPVVTGDAVDGQTFTTSNGTWTMSGSLSYTYYWLRCQSDDSCDFIADASSATYVLTPADVGFKIKSLVVAGNGEDEPDGQYSELTDVVQAAPPVNTGVPSIDGDALEGETLTGHIGTWTGTPTIDYTYQWFRCTTEDCDLISGADESTYTVTGDDVGYFIMLEVYANNDGGSDSTFSAPTDVVLPLAPTLEGNPEVTGNTVTGSTLTTSNGDWVSSGPLTYTYLWHRCDGAGQNCDDISGATNQTYVLVSGDVGSTFYATVTATNDGGSDFASSSPPVGPVSAPVDPNRPVITGTPTQGQTLTTSNGLWPTLYLPNTSFSYQWRRCDNAGVNCVNISGATNNTYLLTAADVGHKIRAVVDADWAGEDHQTQTTLATAVVTGTRTPPVITGTTTDGQTLTTTNGTWTMSGSLNYSIYWYRCEVEDGGDCNEIPDADGSTYLLTPADVGFKVKSLVIAFNGEDEPDGQFSEETDVVQARAPDNTILPTTAGDPAVGETFTSEVGTWTGTPEITYEHQWFRCNDEDCELIDDATDSSYTATNADIGWYLVVAVTGTNAGGSDTAWSDPSATILPQAPFQEGNPEVSGDPVEGATLTTTDGDWVSPTPITYTYQWLRCDLEGENCEEIEGATDQDYVVTADDIGFFLTADVTATNDGGSNDAQASPPIGPITLRPAPANDEMPVITGTTTSGHTLTTTNGDWSSYETPTFTYQWMRCAASGANCVGVGGATASTLALTDGDIGHSFKVIVTATNGSGSTPMTAAFVGPVDGSPLAVTQAATALTDTGAQLNGTVDSRYADSDYLFEWGTDANDLSHTSTGMAPAATIGASPKSLALTDLNPSTTYYFRISAQSDAGESTGEVLSFTTAATPVTPPAPAARPAPKFGVAVATSSQTMEHASFAFTLPSAGSGTFSGTVKDDKRHVGAAGNGKGSTGKTFTAFSRTFTEDKAGSFSLPAKLSDRALDILRDRGFLRVSMTAKFTPVGGGEIQIYKQVVKLRPFAISAFGTDAKTKSVSATLRTPRTGRLAVTFQLRNHTTGESTDVKAFAGREVAGGSYKYSAPLSSADRADISSGKVRLMVKAELNTKNYPARMLRSRYTSCDFCG